MTHETCRRYKLAIGVLAVIAAGGAAAAQTPAPPRYANDSTASGIAHSYVGGWEFFVGGQPQPEAVSFKL